MHNITGYTCLTKTYIEAHKVTLVCFFLLFFRFDLFFSLSFLDRKHCRNCQCVLQVEIPEINKIQRNLPFLFQYIHHHHLLFFRFDLFFSLSFLDRKHCRNC